MSERRTAHVQQVAAAFGVSERGVWMANRLLLDAPDLAERCRAGELTLSAATRLLRERNGGSGLTDAQQRRAEQADMLTMRLACVVDEWLTDDRANRLVDLWVKHGDGGTS